MDSDDGSGRRSVGKRLRDGFLDKPVLGIYVLVLLVLAFAFLILGIVEFF